MKNQANPLGGFTNLHCGVLPKYRLVEVMEKATQPIPGTQVVVKQRKNGAQRKDFFKCPDRLLLL